MKPYWTDGQATFYHGDVLDVLRELPDGTAQTCVTSPPYWGLRDYGTATWEGGDAECRHEPPAEWVAKQFNANSNLAGTSSQSAAAKTRWFESDGACRCGARRIDQQLGLEATPEEYVERMVGAFREVKRVLRDDATLWLNIGDSYTSGGRNNFGPSKPDKNIVLDMAKRAPQPPNMKPKDLVGIPWMLAFALRADGWYLRQDIIWAKPNPMPESVTDRCTKAHEYMFLLTKSARYYYDQDALREPAQERPQPDASNKQISPNATSWLDNRYARGASGYGHNPNGRNRRSVWTIATEAYPEAHFATFPTALVKPCVLAGSREGDVVLDPFLGSGTTAWVAKSLGRRAIGIDLNATYLDLAVKRNRQMALVAQ